MSIRITNSFSFDLSQIWRRFQIIRVNLVKNCGGQLEIMLESKVDDSICRMRAENREELSIQRKKGREDVLRQKRLKLSEVEALTSNITLEQFKELALGIKQKKPSLELLRAIKNSCCTPTYIEAFFKTNGAFDSLIRILVGKDAHLQLESVACLTNLACGSHKGCHRIAKRTGAYLVSFITGGNMYLQDQSAWAAGNIANDCLECFSHLKAQGILPALLLALQSPSSDVIQSSIYALHACTKYENSDLMELTDSKTTKLLLEFVKQEGISLNTRSDAAFTLANIYYILAENNTDVHYTVAEPILSLLSSMISNNNIDALIALPLIRCLGFLSTCDSVSQHLSQHPSFYDIVIPVLSDKILRKEMLWVLTNVVVSCDREILDFNIVLKIIDFLNPLGTLALQALYFLCILVSRSENMKTSLIQQSDIIVKVSILLHSGKKSMEIPCKYFCNMLNIDL